MIEQEHRGSERATTRLRSLLARPGIVQAPGAWDALSARVIEAAGDPAISVGGTAIAAAHLALPDTGLLTSTEIIAVAGRIAGATRLPVICDADAGYGNPLNVARTVRSFEGSGVAGIHLEDEVFPRTRYAHPDRQLCSVDEMRRRLDAALAARRDPDFVLIARTDARLGRDLAETVGRIEAYATTGVDICYVEHLTSREEFERVAAAIGHRVPLLANMTEFSRYPLLTASELEALGYRIVIYPLTILRAALGAARAALDELAATGSQAGFLDRLAPRTVLPALTDTDLAMELEREYLPPEDAG